VFFFLQQRGCEGSRNSKRETEAETDPMSKFYESKEKGLPLMREEKIFEKWHPNSFQNMGKFHDGVKKNRGNFRSNLS